MRKNRKALILAGLIVALMLCMCLVACGGSDYIEKNAKKLSTYTIEAGFDDSAKTLSAVMVFDFYNTTDNAFSELKFHLYPNAYRKDASLPVVDELTRSKAYKNGFSYGDIKIDSAKCGDTAVAYVVEGTDSDILTVPLGTEVFPQQNVKVEIVFEVCLANIWHRLGYGNNTINLGNWYPQLCVFKNGAWLTDPYYSNGDPFVSEMANYCVALTAHKDFMIAASGVPGEAQTKENDNVRTVYTAKSVRDFALVMSPKFQKASATVDSTTVNYYYFSDRAFEESLSTATKALRYFSSTFGKYPYAKLDVVETGLLLRRHGISLSRYDNLRLGKAFIRDCDYSRNSPSMVVRSRWQRPGERGVSGRGAGGVFHAYVLSGTPRLSGRLKAAACRHDKAVQHLYQDSRQLQQQYKHLHEPRFERVRESAAIYLHDVS